MKKVPRSFERTLWSYRLDQMDLERDKKPIITQVLNYGTWEEQKLLFHYYSEADIRAVIAHPRRGTWIEKALNFWIKMLDIRTRKEIYQKAIINPAPHTEP